MKKCWLIAFALLPGMLLAGSPLFHDGGNIYTSSGGVQQVLASGITTTNPMLSSNVTVNVVVENIPYPFTYYLDNSQAGAVSGSGLASEDVPTVTTTSTWAAVTNNQYLNTNVLDQLIESWPKGEYEMDVYAYVNSITDTKRVRLGWDSYIWTNGVEYADVENSESSAQLTTVPVRYPIKFSNTNDWPVPAGGRSGTKIVVKEISGSGGDPTVYIITGPPYYSAFRTPGAAGAGVTHSEFDAHASRHAGAGADPITSLGAVTRTGTDNYAGNAVTNVGTESVTNVLIQDRLQIGPAPYSTDADIDVVGDAITKLRLSTYSTNAFHKPYFMSQRAGGSRASPSAGQSGWDMGAYWCWGHDGSAAGIHDGTGFNPGVGFLGYFAETWNTNQHGSAAYIQTVHTNTTTLFNDFILLNGILTLQYQSCVRAGSSVTQAVANATYAPLVLQSETIDTAGEFVPSNCLFTAKQAGTYLVDVKVQWGNTDAAKAYQVWIAVGGSSAYVSSQNSSATFTTLTQHLTELISLSAGGTIQGQVYQNSGGVEVLDQYGSTVKIIKVK